MYEIPFDAAFEYYSHDYATQQHSHIYHREAELPNADSAQITKIYYEKDGCRQHILCK